MSPLFLSLFLALRGKHYYEHCHILRTSTFLVLLSVLWLKLVKKELKTALVDLTTCLFLI